MAEPTEERKFTAAEQCAAARRDNEFRDLAKALSKGMAAGVSCVQLELAGGQKIVIHTSPGTVSELLVAQQQTLKQLEIVINELVDLLTGGGQLTFEALMERCALSAEKTASVINRAILSQGQGQGGIIKPS